MLKTLPIWQQNHLNDCLDRELFEDSKVLEVGGNTPEEITKELKVKRWVCIDPLIGDYESDDKKYCKVNGSISNFTKENEFDLIFATNSFEHINNLDIAINKMYELLKYGGKLSALMGPIWSCHKGNHVWLVDHEYNITYNNSKIPDWGHLIYKEDDLSEIITPYYNNDVKEKLIRQIYYSDFVNRLFYDDYVKITKNSRFKILEFRDWHTSKLPDDNLQSLLQAKYNKKNFSTVSIKMLLEKTKI